MSPYSSSSNRSIFLGAFLVTSGFALFVYALTTGSSSDSGWAKAGTLAPLIIGLALVASFLVWQWFLGRSDRIGMQPLMPLSIWQYPNLPLIMIIITLSFMNFTGTLIFWSTLWFQEINHVSPLDTTARYLPQAIGGMLVNLFAAYTLHIIPGKILLIVAECSFTGAALLFALQPVHITYWAMSFPSLVLSVVGADLAYMVCNLFVTESVPNRLKSTAGAIFNTVIQLATTIGLGVGSAVANSISQKGPHPGESPEDFLARTYHGAYWFAVSCTALAIPLCLFVKVGTQGHKTKEETEDEEQPIDGDSNVISGSGEDEDVRGNTIVDNKENAGEVNSQKEASTLVEKDEKMAQADPTETDKIDEMIDEK